MGRLILISCFSFLMLFTVIVAGPLDGLEYQSESVATAEYVTSGMINPAGLTFFGAMGVRYSHAFTDSTYKGDDAFLVSSQRGFFGIEWLNHSTNIFRRKYTLAFADKLAPNFYMGVSYSWFGGSNGLYKNLKTWKIGLMYHPRRFVSMGLVTDQLTQPRFDSVRQRRLYRPGLAIRPLGDRFTVSSDIRWFEGDNVDRLEANFRMAFGPFRGVFLSADYKTEGFWHIGVTFDIDQAKIGGQGRLGNSREFDGGSYFIELGAIRYGSVYRQSGRTATVVLSGDIVEEPPGRQLFRGRKKSFYTVISAIRKAAVDPRFDELLVKIDGIRLNFANAQELRNALIEYRRKGKRVTVFFNRAGSFSYYLASVANRIYMNPSGYLELKGLSATATFYKGTMEKIGVKAQVVRTGPHKTYGDPYTESGLTEAAREQLNWLMDDLYDQLVDGISTGRKILPEDVRKLIDNGPYTARDAYAAGLVDGLMYYDELVESDGHGEFTRQVDLLSFYETEDYYGRWSEPKKIAIVYADGSIRPGSSGFSILEGKQVGSSTLSKSLERVRSDKRIKAVVFRINSPGGDLFASEKIYRQLELLKGKKPLVISMGGVAASGGYYVASPGDDILASPGTITGSIGIVVGKPVLTGLYEKIGLKKETIRRGKHADIRSAARPATDEEFEMVERQVWQYYDELVSKISTWRKLDYDSVDAVSQGRVWTGRQALEHGLIDSYGGIWEAVELARQKAAIDPRDKLIVEIYPRYGIKIFGLPAITGYETQLVGLLGTLEANRLSLKLPYDLKIE